MTLPSDATTLELVLAVDPADHDRLIAELNLIGFEAFLQHENELRAYGSFVEWTPELALRVEAALTSMGRSVEPVVRFVAPENWNAQWERSIAPLAVGQFVITPSWRKGEPGDTDLIRLEIDPKMSFGTGYHATTRLMLRMLPSVIREGDRVLDLGTGTGILAIAAARLGASHVLGVDIDPWSEQNARENCARNDVAGSVEIRLSDVDGVPEKSYRAVLANIQLDVIVASLPAITTRLENDGRLLVSGILSSQTDDFIAAATASNLTVFSTASEDEWWAAALQRT